ncbi:Rid family hydrolase [Methylobacterium gregans]|uniref:Rid family hydrolase n=1 Tax=Methylobacterium gregans TaxID=374424 RepID=UPI002794C3F1|nr:Rid family hydrolase [Methylobacterium gregans]MDQ0524204.1 enamine deaminase RidA (YjgF/YER057c/UK114 family) [Methylobacterium gregans]
MTTLNLPTVWAVPDQVRTIYAHAREVPAGRTLFVSGQFGVAPDGQMRAEFAEQLGQAMANAEALLAAAGMAMTDVRKATFILTRTDDLCVLERVRQAR